MIWGYEDYSRQEREEIYCQRAECKYNNMARDGWVHNACDYCVQTGKSRIAQSGDPDWRFCKCFEPGEWPKADSEVMQRWMDRVKERDRKRAEQKKREAEKARPKKKKYDRKPKIDNELAYRLWRDGANDRQAAEIMGISQQTYARWRQHERLQSRNSPPKLLFDQKEARRLYDQGETDADIGRKLDVSATCIRTWRMHEGLPTKYVRGKRIKLEQDLKRLYLEGKSDEEIAGELGCTASLVGDWRRSMQLRPHSVKEKERQDKIVRAMVERGASVKEIASKVGLDTKTVYARLKRMGVEIAPGRKDERDIRGKMYAEGATDREIAEAVGKDAGDITRWRHRNGLPANKRKK